MKKKFELRIFIYVIATIGVLSAIAFPCHFCGAERFFDKLVDINYLDLLLGQVANTLIVLSLTSVLSSNFGQVYWEDIKSKKLIEPFLGCFVGITTYLLTAMGYSVFSYAVGFKSGVMISAIVAIVLLMVLTGKMIGIYFGRERLKNKLSVDYRKLVILKNSEDLPWGNYINELEDFKENLGKENFSGKTSTIRKINKEINELDLNISSHMNCFKRLERLTKDLEKKDFPNKDKFLGIIEERKGNYLSRELLEDFFCELKKIIEEEDFPKKNKFLTIINKASTEIDTYMDKVNQCISNHIKKKQEASEVIKGYDKKIEEYTKNAIKENKTEVVMENIELLVDSKNYYTFMNLLEELFDWDEKYACLQMMRMSKKDQVQSIEDKIDYFKQYALQKLISQGGELDAIKTLLWVYDSENRGGQILRRKIGKICDERENVISRLDSLGYFEQEGQENATDNDHNEIIKKLENEGDKLYKKLKAMIEKTTTKEMRSFYIPIQESYLAYNEGKYEIANKYLRVIFACFKYDLEEIKVVFKRALDYAYLTHHDFLYITDEERGIIDQLIKSDEANKLIPEKIKKDLEDLKKTIRITTNDYGQIMTSFL